MSRSLAAVLVLPVMDEDPGGVGALQHEAEVDHDWLHVGDVQSHLVPQQRSLMLLPVKMSDVQNWN